MHSIPNCPMLSILHKIKPQNHKGSEFRWPPPSKIPIFSIHNMVQKSGRPDRVNAKSNDLVQKERKKDVIKNEQAPKKEKPIYE